MEKYKLTVEYESPDRQQAIKLAEDALDQLPLLNHTLEVLDQAETDSKGAEVWDEVEA